jgi:hypothetical protein
MSPSVYDNNGNGTLDIYYNVDRNSPDNDEFYSATQGITDENAIIIVDGGFTYSFKIRSTINIGDTQIEVPGIRGFKASRSDVYTIFDPRVPGQKEYFYVTEIDSDNNMVRIRTVDDDERETAENGFVHNYVIENRPGDPYIFDLKPAGVNTSPVIVENIQNLIHVTIPHEMLHKDFHFLLDVASTEKNIMNCSNTEDAVIDFPMPLRFFELQPVRTAECLTPTGNPQSQWSQIARQE